MIWEHPWALALLVLLPLIAWLGARSRAPFASPTQRGLHVLAQVLAAAAIVLALAGPWRRADSGRPTRVVIAGAGTPAATIAAWREATPYQDPFYVVTPGARPATAARGAIEPAAAEGAPDLSQALARALALGEPGAALEVAVLGSAGHAGPPLTDLEPAPGVRIHVRAEALADPGPALLEVRHPARVGAREPFRAELDVRAAAAAAARLRIEAGGERLAELPVAVRPGTSTLLVDVPPLPREGLHELSFALLVEGLDADPERRTERRAILAEGSPRLLWLGPSDQAFAALRDTIAPHGLLLERAAPAAPFAAAPASVFDAVVVDDLPAAAWAPADQAALVEAVLGSGTGVLLAGAHRNLGPGGYADSPLAEVLPVDLPQREERRDPSVAVVLVIDTSGSMGNRIELAKEVARLALRRLLPHDKAGIVEFYGSKRWAAPLQPASNTIELMRALNRMQAGGGTVIYTALEESYYALLNVQTRFKHILVLTDGGVESGPFEALARRVASSGINLSTVLIGPQSNSPFLMNLAQWGRGRFYAAPSRFQLPDLRFKEPQTTLMPAIQERPFGIEVPGSHEGARSLADREHRIGGLVEARLRLGAEPLVQVSDGGQPLLAAWDQGAGRVAVLATELLGPMADTVREQGWATLIADQLRSLARGREANRPRLEVESWPNSLRVRLVDPLRPGWPHPRLVLGEGRGTPLAAVSLTPDRAAGEFSADLPWPSERPLRVAVEGSALAAAAVRPLPRGSRLRDASAGIAALAASSGGSVEGPLPAEPGPAAAGPARTPIRPLLILVAIAAFLVSLLVRRWPAAPRARIAGLALCGMVGLGSVAPAQEPADDPIQARIQAELRELGHLDRLRAAWAEGSRAERLALAHETGDLDAVLALTADAPEDRPLRAAALEARGRIDEALAVVRDLLADPALDAATRAQWQLRAAELATAAEPPQPEAAAAAFRAAAASLDDPWFHHAVGHLAAGHGLLEVGLDLHRAPDDASPAARTATHLRRGAWCERLSAVDRALAEYRAAAAAAPLRRERSFALARQIALMKAAERLPELAAAWTAGLAELDTEHKAALLDALRELEQGGAALDLLARTELLDEPELQDQALAIAVEAGRTEAAVDSARTRLAADPDQPRLRVSLALLLTDLRRNEEARAVLLEGMRGAARRELLLLVEAASELGDEAAFRDGLAVLRARGEERDRIDAILLEFQHQRRKQRNDLAVRALLDARPTAVSPEAKVRLAEALESADRSAAAIELYREAHEATRTEDLALRLAWLLSNSKEPKEREESAALFREIWLNAGSAARRVQAEERVLDIAARDGKLADLAIELEEALTSEGTEHRDQKREALVKIWARAQDTFGAREVLMQWARQEPEHEIDAWQRLAQVHLENEEFKGHERALRHLIDVDPENELDYRQQLALGFLERGRPVEARAVIREMLDDGAEADAVAFEFSAGIFSLAGRHREAADLYRRALAIHPDRIETLLLWANAMAAQERGAEAVGRFVDILLREVQDDLFLVAVDGLLNLEAPREALRFAERALRRRIAAKPDRVFLQRALQDVLEALADEDARLQVLEETLLVAGQQRTTWLRELMDESARRRDWPGYLREARALLQTGDEVPPAVFLEIGEALLKTGELRAAERAFARARLATDFAKVEDRVAELFEKAGRIEDAERVRRRVLRRDPGDPTALVAVARLVEQRGDRDDALGLYRDAARTLLEGQDLEAEQPQPRGFTRNRTQTGPGFEEALEGVLRCAGGPADTEPLRADLAARLAAAAEAPAPARLATLARMRRLATAWDDPDEETRLQVLEDEVLAKAAGVDDALRLSVFGQRVARGDLAGAEAVLAGLPGGKDRGPRVRLALLRGDAEAAIGLLGTSKPSELYDAARTLGLLGRDEAVARLRGMLEERAADDEEAAQQFDRLRELLGEEVDPRPRMDASLEAAKAGTGELRQRVGRLTAALRSHEFLTDAERAELLRPLVAEAVEAKDGQAAWTILSAARSWFADGELAPLVPLLFDGQQQIYLVTSRVSFVDLLPVDEGTKVLREAFARFPDAEVRSQILRLLASGELPAAQHRPLLSGLRLTELQPADRTWLTRLCCDGELPAETADIVLRAMRRDLPGDPRTAILAARTGADPAAARAELEKAAPLLAKDPQPDYGATQAIEKLATLADAGLREALLAAPPAEGAPVGALLLRAELLRAADRDPEAADLLLAASLRQPDNSLLLHRTQPLLQALGRLDDAVRLYAAHLDAAAQVYPFQAGQLARLQLERGDPARALDTLRRAEDDSGTNLGIQLRATVALEDAGRRAQELRNWVQQAQRSRRGSGGVIRFFSGQEQRGTFHGPDAVLAAATTPRLLPATIEEAQEDGDLLAFLPEGAAAAEALLRCLRDEERDQALALYRGLLGSLARFATTTPALERMRARLERSPFDAEALRTALAAAQVGLPIAAEVLERAIVQRAADPRVDAGVLVDLLWTAQAAQRDDLVGRMLGTLLQDRGRLSSYQIRERIGDVLQLAAGRDPGLLLGLAPGRASINAHLDGDLLAVLATTAVGPEQLAEGFADLPEYLTRNRPNHWASRVALPWAGVCARRGDFAAAVAALQVDDPQTESGDPFPPRNLGAAVPPLALWAEPERAPEFGAAIVAALDAALPAGRRGLLLRAGFLLAIRLDEAGQTEAARELRAGLGTRLGSAAFVRPWLESDAAPRRSGDG
jgi:Tfp pilus assembly protein PilF